MLEQFHMLFRPGRDFPKFLDEPDFVTAATISIAFSAR
jgi:hypothetical protein